jgi:hypothetical protein
VNDKILIYGRVIDEKGASGLGNYLEFFPGYFVTFLNTPYKSCFTCVFLAAYYFAMITGRYLIVEDNSIIGDFCSSIQCGFPFRSELFHSEPKHMILNQDGMHRYMRGELNLTEIIKTNGFNAGERFYYNYDEVRECAAKITGCSFDGEQCMDAFALQKLVKGPVFASPELDKLTDTPNEFKQELLHQPYLSAPVVDVAVHLRLEFLGFEFAEKFNESLYEREVQTWLQSDLRRKIFNAVSSKLGQLLTSVQKTLTEPRPIRVYLAADNAEVKNELHTHIANSPNLQNFTINIMQLKAGAIQHVVYITSNSTTISTHAGLFHLSFDWYMISLATYLLGWRKGDEGSSYASSARHIGMKPLLRLHKTIYENPYWSRRSLISYFLE